MTHGTDNSQTHLQEDLLKIGAEHTRFGLGVGIFVSLLVVSIGLFFVFAVVNGFSNGVSQQNPSETFGYLLVGILVSLFGFVLCWRQVKMRDQITGVLEKRRN